MCLVIEIHGKLKVFQFWEDEFCQLKQRDWYVVGDTAIEKAEASPREPRDGSEVNLWYVAPPAAPLVAAAVDLTSCP